MKFIKLHYYKREILVNMNLVTDIHKELGNKSTLYFNYEAGGDQAHLDVDESIDEIFKKVNGE